MKLKIYGKLNPELLSPNHYLIKHITGVDVLNIVDLEKKINQLNILPR